VKKYQIIYADPPWQYKRKGGSGAGRIYSTMTVEEICGLPVKEIADRNSLLFLWTTNSFMREAFDVVESWGFTYKTCMTWDKINQGLGYWLWGKTEHLFVCAKGKHKRITPPISSTIIHVKKGKHSQKPVEVRRIVEKFPHTDKIELFARQKSPGWDVWGNEVESDIILK